jgi:hypothetical protein
MNRRKRTKIIRLTDEITDLKIKLGEVTAERDQHIRLLEQLDAVLRDRSGVV